MGPLFVEGHVPVLFETDGAGGLASGMITPVAHDVCSTCTVLHHQGPSTDNGPQLMSPTHVEF